MKQSGMVLGVLLFAASCHIGARSGAVAQEENEDQEGARCQPCEFLGNAGTCLDRNLGPVKDALEDPVTGPFLENGASACGPSNEVCVPCVDPISGESTGSCDFAPLVCDGIPGTCDSPQEVLDPDTFPTCALGGVCVPKSIVAFSAPDNAERLPACEQTRDGVCTPRESLRYGGNYTPPSCQLAGVLEGRCLPSFVLDEEQRDRLEVLPNDPKCSARSEICAPCYDPLTGEDTGACSTSQCDSPRSAGGFATCVNQRGLCIPPALIQAQNPGQSLENLAQHDCSAESLCVPNRLAAQPTRYQACGTLLGGDGTCLDVDVLVDIPLSNLFSQGGCPAVEKCVPCDTFGQPTDAPGCDVLY